MKLGEQWVEIIDGQEHMVKVVERKTEKLFDCSGCFYNDHKGNCLYHSQDCPIGLVQEGYVKDLGILREGLLPSFWGEYPKKPYLNGMGDWIVFCVSEDECMMQKVIASTKQQAIDAWNRRA